MPPVTDISDPRLQALFGANDPRDAGAKPVVRLPRRGLSPLALAAIALVFGVLLFMVLDERRLSQAEPTVRQAPSEGASAWAPPPPLYVPPVPQPAPAPIIVQEQKRPAEPAPVPTPAPVIRQAPAQPIYMPQPLPPVASAPPPQARVAGGAPLVIDTSNTAAAPAGRSAAMSRMPTTGDTVTRMRASAFANRSMTVPQGYLIPAVLETGFDSTQPGFARAIVSRDVRSFDGINVLIPRGSKLVGEYHSDVGQGQKRAVIVWTRLIRPDGMTIAIDSPAVDTVGRGGVAANVNTHFLARFGDALLQSTVGIGSALAQRSITGPVVVLPSTATGATGQLIPSNTYVPTLTVPAGKSISIFVAHDLDFSSAGFAR